MFRPRCQRARTSRGRSGLQRLGSRPPVTPVVPAGGAPIPVIWQITGGEAMNGLWRSPWLLPAARRVQEALFPAPGRDTRLVSGIAEAIGRLEATGHFGPFAVVLDQQLFLVAQTPSPSLVLPQDRITPFLGGGPLLRSSTLNAGIAWNGVVVALGGAPVELVVATDVCVQFLQLTAVPRIPLPCVRENGAPHQGARSNHTAGDVVKAPEVLQRLIAAGMPKIDVRRLVHPCSGHYLSQRHQTNGSKYR